MAGFLLLLLAAINLSGTVAWGDNVEPVFVDKNHQECVESESERACRDFLSRPESERGSAASSQVLTLLCSRLDGAACMQEARISLASRDPMNALKMFRKACALGQRDACLEISKIAKENGAPESASLWRRKAEK